MHFISLSYYLELYLYGHFPDHPHVYLQLLRKLAEQVLVGSNSSYSEPLPYTVATAAHKRVRVIVAQRPLRNYRKCPPIYKKCLLWNIFKLLLIYVQVAVFQIKNTCKL